tara:strand:- start:546 stop:1175 length:630 start_codon:yes stop_codon:yes gene_type:complete
MKWLLLFLLSVNAVIFIIQIKDVEEGAKSSQYVAVTAAKELGLLNELVVNAVARERCIVVGEIDDQRVITDLSAFLDARAVEYELIEKKQEMAPSYWVFAQGDAGKELIAKLNDMGVDSYLISDGKWAGRVSLGLFANIDLAQDLIKVLKGRGVEAVFVEKKKYKKTKWLSFRLGEISRSDSLLEDLKALELNVGEIKEFFCKSIASEK